MPTVQIEFHTEKIDRKKYEAAILEYLFSHVNRNDLDKAHKINQWTIKILPVSMIVNNKDFVGISGTLGGGIPHGVTNANTKMCKIFVNDMKGDLILQQNFMTISHELAHMILSIYYPFRRSRYRYDDKSWGKAGAEGNFFTVEVHDREKEMVTKKKWIRIIWVWKRNFLGRGIGKVYLPCFDILDLTDTRLEDRNHSFYG